MKNMKKQKEKQKKKKRKDHLKNEKEEKTLPFSNGADGSLRTATRTACW